MRTPATSRPLRRIIALLLPALLHLLPPTAAAQPQNTTTPPTRPPQSITTLYLFVHCLGSWDQPGVRAEYTAKWRDLLAAEGPKPDTAVCFLTSGPEASVTIDLAHKLFGPRCIVDPEDKSPATKALIADDLEASFKQRGMISEWTPYEMWTSTNARRWSEGLKIELRNRNLTFDPRHLRVVACGQQWGGCLAKYSAFMGRHLGLAKPAEIRPDLSPYAGYPFKATLRHQATLDRHVQLFLFETADGKPMAQFFDGLRGVFEPAHVALVPLPQSNVELTSVPPNQTQHPQPVANPIASDKIMVDVADGCRPVITTVLGKNISYDAFRAALMQSTIAPFANKFDSKTRFLPAGCSDLFCPRTPPALRPSQP